MSESVLDRIRKQVEELSAEEVKEQLAKLQAKAEAKKTIVVSRRKNHGDPKAPKRELTIEEKEEKKAKAKEYRKKKYEREQALIKKAMELGITGEVKK